MTKILSSTLNSNMKVSVAPQAGSLSALAFQAVKYTCSTNNDNPLIAATKLCVGTPLKVIVLVLSALEILVYTLFNAQSMRQSADATFQQVVNSFRRIRPIQKNETDTLGVKGNLKALAQGVKDNLKTLAQNTIFVVAPIAALKLTRGFVVQSTVLAALSLLAWEHVPACMTKAWPHGKHALQIAVGAAFMLTARQDKYRLAIACVIYQLVYELCKNRAKKEQLEGITLLTSNNNNINENDQQTFLNWLWNWTPLVGAIQNSVITPFVNNARFTALLAAAIPFIPFGNLSKIIVTVAVSALCFGGDAVYNTVHRYVSCCFQLKQKNELKKEPNQRSWQFYGKILLGCVGVGYSAGWVANVIIGHFLISAFASTGGQSSAKAVKQKARQENKSNDPVRDKKPLEKAMSR